MLEHAVAIAEAAILRIQRQLAADEVEGAQLWKRSLISMP
jgi:hypothetical protein